jgi:hypothetical protein
LLISVIILSLYDVRQFISVLHSHLERRIIILICFTEVLMEMN